MHDEENNTRSRNTNTTDMTLEARRNKYMRRWADHLYDLASDGVESVDKVNPRLRSRVGIRGMSEAKKDK